MRKNYQSEALMVCHQMAEDLYQSGIISENEMREFDADCLIQPTEFGPEAWAIRERPVASVYAEAVND